MRIVLTLATLFAAGISVIAQGTQAKKPATKSAVAKSTSAKSTSAKSSTLKAAKPTATSTASKSAATAKPKTTGKASAATAKAPARYRRASQTQPTLQRYREIQQALADKGYFDGPVDGTWGPSSTEALKRFQREQKLVDDGKITSLSLIALGLGPPNGVLPTAPTVQEPTN